MSTSCRCNVRLFLGWRRTVNCSIPGSKFCHIRQFGRQNTVRLTKMLLCCLQPNPDPSYIKSNKNIYLWQLKVFCVGGRVGLLRISSPVQSVSIFRKCILVSTSFNVPAYRHRPCSMLASSDCVCKVGYISWKNKNTVNTRKNAYRKSQPPARHFLSE